MKNALIVVVVACAGLWVASRSGTAVSAPLPPEVGKPQPVKWEYGHLQVRTAPRWTCNAEDTTGENDEELAKKLKAELPKDASEHVISMAILNQLGSQGWEMVTHIKMGTYDFYRFKRQLMPKG